jgi:hypothetical protein
LVFLSEGVIVIIVINCITIKIPDAPICTCNWKNCYVDNVKNYVENYWKQQATYCSVEKPG